MKSLPSDDDPYAVSEESEILEDSKQVRHLNVKTLEEKVEALSKRVVSRRPLRYK
jgi:hypothetical protein